MASEITEILQTWRRGESAALDELIPMVENELRRLARSAMRSEHPGHTLQPTALVNEAFLRLVKSDVPWQDRAHFFAVSARLMRRILVDHARSVHREKRGGDAARLTLHESDAVDSGPDVDILSLDAALAELEARDAIQCRIIELCYFAGLTYPEIAEALQISRATVGRELRFAKAWLKARLQDAPAARADY